MKKGVRFLSATLAAVMVLGSLAACGGNQAAESTADTNAAPESVATVEVDPSIMVELNGEQVALADIVAGAQAEGDLQSVGMPDDWANWKGSWEGITATYGIPHGDVDMTSAEEIAIFLAEKDDPTKDVGDIGLSMTPEAIKQDAVGTYKASTWDSFPDWAKDPDGHWIMTYTGSLSFLANTDLTGGVCPTSWAEVAEGDYLVSPGNVISGAASQIAVLSAAYAFGGGIDNVQPGIDFFKKLAEAGRLDTGDTISARMASGEMALCVAQYDYSTIAWKENILAENPEIKLEITIPTDGSVTNGYCQIINKYAAHPNAAALAIEYLCSDEGAIDRAEGYARPTKTDVELPAELAEKLLPDEMYANCVNITDVEALNAACMEIAKLWEEQVLPLVQ